MAGNPTRSGRRQVLIGAGSVAIAGLAGCATTVDWLADTFRPYSPSPALGRPETVG